MRARTLQRLRTGLGIGTVALGILSLALAVTAVRSDATEARIISAPTREMPWLTITEEQVESGMTVPPNTHVLFHLPFSFERIHREVLLGGRGEKVRYWGYCLPENYDPEVTGRRQGFPGLLFLSEAERSAQEEARRLRNPRPSVFDPATAPASDSPASRVRHQLDRFLPGNLCYLMTAEPLPIGLDHDDDRLNDEVERNIGTDPTSPDTDGDGLLDGTEYVSGTNPKVRDTDGDGLIDGLEDRNFNGRTDVGETSAKNRDTDRDGLCDGICRLRLSNGQEIFIGEDLNLSGTLDEGETDPLTWDTDGDGINDYDTVLGCLTGSRTLCP